MNFLPTNTPPGLGNNPAPGISGTTPTRERTPVNPNSSNLVQGQGQGQGHGVSSLQLPFSNLGIASNLGFGSAASPLPVPVGGPGMSGAEAIGVGGPIREVLPVQDKLVVAVDFGTTYSG